MFHLCISYQHLGHYHHTHWLLHTSLFYKDDLLYYALWAIHFQNGTCLVLALLRKHDVLATTLHCWVEPILQIVRSSKSCLLFYLLLTSVFLRLWAQKVTPLLTTFNSTTRSLCNLTAMRTTNNTNRKLISGTLWHPPLFPRGYQTLWDNSLDKSRPSPKNCHWKGLPLRRLWLACFVRKTQHLV